MPSWYVTIKYNLNQYCFLFVKILCSIERPAKTGYLLFIGKDYCNIFIPCIYYTTLLIHLQEQLDASKTYPSAAVKNIELIREATERALETTLAPFGVVKALQSDTSGCDLVFESISGVVTL